MHALSYTLFIPLLVVLLFDIPRIHAVSLPEKPQSEITIHCRQEGSPSFPSDPPSCPICAQSYPSINSCAQAAPVLANVSMVLFNPGAFIDVIKCACTDTFQAAYPQCADCFTRTNQTQFLSAPAGDLPDIISGIRSICSLESSFIGNVSGSATASGALPTDTSDLPSAAIRRFSPGLAFIIGAEGLAGLLVAAVLGFAADFICLIS